jgi:hypothetical protein
MGVEYSLNGTAGTGDQVIADEYGAGPFCRPDDNDENAGNEWSGAWSHSNPTEGAEGVYRFEISRTLNTASTRTDKPMAVGETYHFGFAFWDPFETDDGWTGAGHYVTGCSSEWIDLVIEAEGGATSNGFARVISAVTIAAVASVFFVAL